DVVPGTISRPAIKTLEGVVGARVVPLHVRNLQFPRFTQMRGIEREDFRAPVHGNVVEEIGLKRCRRPGPSEGNLDLELSVVLAHEVTADAVWKSSDSGRGMHQNAHVQTAIGQQLILNTGHLGVRFGRPGPNPGAFAPLNDGRRSMVLW